MCQLSLHKMRSQILASKLGMCVLFLCRVWLPRQACWVCPEAHLLVRADTPLSSPTAMDNK